MRAIQFPGTLLSLVLIVAPAGCASTSGGGGGGNGTVTGCPAAGDLPAGWVGEQAHLDCAGGAGIGCTCDASGQWLYGGSTPCADFKCASFDCTYQGQTHHPGDTFPAADGCNTCSCSPWGQLGCTMNPCPTDAGAD